MKYNRLRATPWLGATPPSQQPYSGNLGGAPRRRRTSHDACSAQLCVTAHALLLAQHLRRTRRCRRGAHTTSGVVRRTFTLGASSFWRTWRPRAHTTSLLTRYSTACPCAQFSEASPKVTSPTKRVCFLTWPGGAVGHFRQAWCPSAQPTRCHRLSRFLDT